MMSVNKVFGILLIVIVDLPKNIESHGMLMEPVNRGSAWRKGFDTPINYDDNGNNCGGFGVQHNTNGGQCGICGDNYRMKRPRPNENTGSYGTGVIVRRYKSGSKIDLVVDLTANHRGYFQFAICPLKNSTTLETEQCFKKYPLTFINKKDKFIIPIKFTGLLKIRGMLPKNFTCKHCVLRWHYHTGNNWGICSNGNGALGCGPQETFRTCSDIAID